MFFGSDILMKAYLLTLTGAILLSAVLSILVSDGKIGKFIKGMTRLFVFSVVILPIASMFGEKRLSFSASEVGTDVGYLKKCAALLSERDETEIKEYLKEEYSLDSEAAVERAAEGNFEREKIVVYIEEFGIFGQEGHIDMIACIQADLEEKYGCQTEVIWQGKG